MSESQKSIDRTGENNPMFGKSGENSPMFGKSHTAEAKALISIAKIGKTHSAKSKAKMSKAKIGKTHSAETLAKMSKAKLGENNSRGMQGKTHSADTLAKIALAKYKKVFVYTLDSDTKSLILHKSFNSRLDAAKYLDCSIRTLYKYLDKKDKLYKEQWILTTSQK